MIELSYAVLAAAGLCFAVRMARGPSLSDRLIAVNGVLLVGMAAVAAQAADAEVGAFLPVVMVLALVSFVGTAIVARFIEGKGG